MVKKLLQIILLTTTLFSYEIVIDKNLDKNEENHIRELSELPEAFFKKKEGWNNLLVNMIVYFNDVNDDIILSRIVNSLTKQD